MTISENEICDQNSIINNLSIIIRSFLFSILSSFYCVWDKQTTFEFRSSKEATKLQEMKI